MAISDMGNDSPYLRAYGGLLRGVLRWRDLDALWEKLRHHDDGGWYVYTVSEAPPVAPVSREEFEQFLDEIRQRLLDEHKEDYCGIVYADDLDAPTFVKIYDPGNLGMVCGSSVAPPLPGWTLSRVAPDDLARAFPRPAVRRRWWRRLLG